MVRMEVYKWRAGIERVMGSAANLGRQREVYLRRAEETGGWCAASITISTQ
jgi:hypothetical protein